MQAELAYQKVRTGLETLQMSAALEALDNVLEAARVEDKGTVEVLDHLLDIEIAARHDRRVETNLKFAGLPYRMRLEVATLLRPKLLILDEVGYTPLERPEATFLFEVIAKRYDRKKAVIVTSNKSWGAWGEILPDQVMTAAILDRLLHRSVTLNIQGESYRLRQHRKAGLSPRHLDNQGKEENL